MAAAVYIHFPFCRHICTYCDFDTFSGLDHLIGSYVDAAVSQIHQSPRALAASLYVGGGTPSNMAPDQAARLIHACHELLALRPDSEAAIEANPTDMGVERLTGYRDAGFNRLSVGVQSTNDRLLRLLGRRHSAAGAATAIRAAREAGFDNVSIDLIYGVPMQDLSMWRETLETVASWGVEHVSCYMLTVEPGTPMEKGVQRGTLRVPPDEAVVEMYDLAGELLGSAGYNRYEISNWALPGRESAHNLTYWRNRPYLGIGAGAAGYWGGRRYKLLPAVRGYVEGVRAGRIPLAEDEPEDRHRDMSDTLILGLRLAEGVSLSAFAARFGVAPYAEFGGTLRWASEEGLLTLDGDRLVLTGRGIVLSNELFEKLL
jgi:oxygen-independent coproporphyrinogen-3 oxidase